MSKWGRGPFVWSACSLWFLRGQVCQHLLFTLLLRRSWLYCWPSTDINYFSKMLNNLADPHVITGATMQRRWWVSLVSFSQRQSLLRHWQGLSQTNFTVSLAADSIFSFHTYRYLGAERRVQAIIQTPRRPHPTWWLPMAALMTPSLIPLAFH